MFNNSYKPKDPGAKVIYQQPFPLKEILKIGKGFNTPLRTNERDPQFDSRSMPTPDGDKLKALLYSPADHEFYVKILASHYSIFKRHMFRLSYLKTCPYYEYAFWCLERLLDDYSKVFNGCFQYIPGFVHSFTKFISQMEIHEEIDEHGAGDARPHDGQYFKLRSNDDVTPKVWWSPPPWAWFVNTISPSWVFKDTDVETMLPIDVPESLYWGTCLPGITANDDWVYLEKLTTDISAHMDQNKDHFGRVKGPEAFFSSSTTRYMPPNESQICNYSTLVVHPLNEQPSQAGRIGSLAYASVMKLPVLFTCIKERSEEEKIEEEFAVEAKVDFFSPTKAAAFYGGFEFLPISGGMRHQKKAEAPKRKPKLGMFGKVPVQPEPTNSGSNFSSPGGAVLGHRHTQLAQGKNLIASAASKRVNTVVPEKKTSYNLDASEEEEEEEEEKPDHDQLGLYEEEETVADQTQLALNTARNMVEITPKNTPGKDVILTELEEAANPPAKKRTQSKKEKPVVEMTTEEKALAFDLAEKKRKENKEKRENNKKSGTNTPGMVGTASGKKSTNQ